jgi:hypothetical protein
MSGTYKLNWNGLSVALTGTVDMRYREKAKDYAFMFSTIVWNLELLFGYIHEPKTLLVDYAGAITNGFIIGFGYAPEFRKIFWAHCLKKFEEDSNESIQILENYNTQINTIIIKDEEFLELNKNLDKELKSSSTMNSKYQRRY